MSDRQRTVALARHLLVAVGGELLVLQTKQAGPGAARP